MTKINVVGKRKLTSSKNGKDYVQLHCTFKTDKVDGTSVFSSFGDAGLYDKYELGKSYDVVLVFADNSVRIYD